MRVSDIEAQIRSKVQLVVKDQNNFSLLSIGERIAVALVLDRFDLMKSAWGTMAESIHRLGYEWMEAALQVQRDGWGTPTTTQRTAVAKPHPMGPQMKSSEEFQEHRRRLRKSRLH